MIPDNRTQVGAPAVIDASMGGAPAAAQPRAIAFKFALAPQISVLNRNDALIRPNISQLAHTNPQP